MMKNFHNAHGAFAFINSFIIILFVTGSLSTNAEASVGADDKALMAYPNKPVVQAMLSAYDANQFIDRTVIPGKSLDDACKINPQSLGCLLLSYLGAGKVNPDLQDAVSNKIKDINNKFALINEKLSFVNSTFAKSAAKQNEIPPSDQKINALLSTLMQNADGALKELTTLAAVYHPSQEQCLKWATDVISTEGRFHSDEDVDGLIKRLAESTPAGNSLLSIYANRMFDSYTSPATYDSATSKEPRKGPQMLTSYYDDFQTYTLGWMLSIQKIESIYSLATVIYEASCGPNSVSKPYGCESVRPRWTSAEVKKLVNDSSRRMMFEFNQQLDRFALRLSAPDAAYQWNTTKLPLPRSFSRNPEFTSLPNEEAKSIDRMFSYADFFTSATLNEWGLRGRIISAGNKFITQGIGAENGERNVNAGICISAAPKGANPRTDQHTCKLISPKALAGLGSDFSKPVEGFSNTDYWTVSRPDPDLTRSDVYDTVYFGKWVFYHYYEPENSDNIKMPPKAGENLFLFTKLPFGTGELPAFVINNHRFGSFFGIERAGGSYALLSGDWKASYVGQNQHNAKHPILKGTMKQIAADPIKLHAGVTMDDYAFDNEGEGYVSPHGEVKLTNTKVISMPENNSANLVAEYSLPNVQAGGYFFDYAQNTFLSAGVGIFFSNSEKPWDGPGHFYVMQKPLKENKIYTGPENLMPYSNSANEYKSVAKEVVPLGGNRYRYMGEINKATLKVGNINFRAYVKSNIFVGHGGFWYAIVQTRSWDTPEFKATAEGQLDNLFILSANK